MTANSRVPTHPSGEPVKPHNVHRLPGHHYRDERVICGECAGYGYFYASTGPSGATIDCDYCGGEGGWLADPDEMRRRMAEGKAVML